MTQQNLQDLERDIEQSRAKLDLTIDRLQDKMTVSGVVDDMLGTARSGGYGSLFDNVLDTIRRNPVPVMLIAMGIGLLAHRISRSSSVAYRKARLARDYDFATDDDFIAEPDFVADVEGTRIYDTGASPLQPGDEMYDRRRSMNSRM
jgi:hypothetical protein